MKVIVIGKNSKVWKSISSQFQKISKFKIKTLSHNSNLTDCQNNIVVLFSVSKKSSLENKILLKNIRNCNPYLLILISSISVLASEKGFVYKYPRLKKEQEDYSKELNFRNLNILRLPSIIEKNQIILRRPDITLTSNRLSKKLYDAIHQKSYLNKTKIIYDHIFLFRNKSLNLLSLFIYRRILFIFRKNIIILRFIDIFLKFFTSLNYGYALISPIVYIKNNSKV